ncbi:MAG: hypothetical protein ABSF70_00375 [Terracidiphilus sp.]
MPDLTNGWVDYGQGASINAGDGRATTCAPKGFAEARAQNIVKHLPQAHSAHYTDQEMATRLHKSGKLTRYVTPVERTVESGKV